MLPIIDPVGIPNPGTGRIALFLLCNESEVHIADNFVTLFGYITLNRIIYEYLYRYPATDNRNIIWRKMNAFGATPGETQYQRLYEQAAQTEAAAGYSPGMIFFFVPV